MAALTDVTVKKPALHGAPLNGAPHNANRNSGGALAYAGPNCE